MTLSRSLTLGVSVLALAGLTVAATGVEARTFLQDEPAGARQAVATAYVSAIRVEGNERIDSQTIVSYLPFQAGATVDAELIDTAVKTLYRTDLFSDVQIQMQGSEMVVTVVESPIINQVVFEGNKAMTKDKLREEVQIRPRGVFTKAKVQEDVQRIVELYRKGGRISATVTPKIVELPQKRVDLIFEIDEGPKTGVSQINFVGNKAFSDNDLKGVVVTQKSLWWKFFSSNDNYDPDRMDYDREQLRKFYTNRGYYDFRIISAVAELTPDRKDFVISYTLDEGEKYNFGRITIKTDNDKLKAENLQRSVAIRPGQLYESDRVEKAVDDLTFAAGSSGFAFVDIRPQEEADPNTKKVDLVFNVHEGARVYIDKVNIVGNTQTLDRVVRRQMLVSEGDAYNKALLERSRIYIAGLGFFKEGEEGVKISEKPSPAAGKTNIEVAVIEQPTGELSFGAGFSSIQKFILDIGISQRNFRGTGQDVRARIQTGSIQKDIDFSFTEPRFMGRNVSAGFDIFSSSYRYRGVDFRTESSGAGLRLGYNLNGYSVLRLRYNIRKDYISTTANNCDSLLYSCGNGLTSSVGYSLSYDRRNDFIQPTRGWNAVLRQDIAGLGGDVKYVATEGEAHWYHGFRKDMILHVSGSAGTKVPWGGDSVRINDRFFKGGDTMRGFEYAGIGPRDINSTYALGGQTYAIGSAELGIPNGLPDQYGLKTALFLDIGTLGGIDKSLKVYGPGTNTPGQINTSIKDDYTARVSAGITIRWKSPMGPIQFDLSQVLSKADYDKVETFRFSQSTQF
ncbi:outer membrane protein assembly complex, YaeT protein [Asticcacaulis sp. AC460]|uniref:outer membrane protein assembly factor BamA n=2 Tax=Asticcacaulis sp. AC460 TaxID=1282360 RepID=UPI0003C3F144|nr:outer membrane protein assembly factor BamA [Asticcacaulis sp. AC460]ESQ89662.1 outer membrane protein assembly complex, YaeT protein [Asticcacaulis sp. AC460]